MSAPLHALGTLANQDKLRAFLTQKDGNEPIKVSRKSLGLIGFSIAVFGVSILRWAMT